MAEVTITMKQMAQTIAAINQKLDQIIDRMDAHSSMTSRMSDGRSLVNVVGTIEVQVNKILSEVD